MLVGHIGAAMLAKQVEPRLSLGTAILAALVPDAFLHALVVAGIEHVQFRTGTAAAPYFTAADIALSHSLVTIAASALLAAGLYAWRRGRGAGAWLLGAVLVAHWVLDLVSYEPFLPVAPGRELFVGWTVARWFELAMVVEAVLWVGALILYVGESRAADSAGRYVFWGGVVSWSYVGWANVAGPPRKPEDAPIEMLILLAMMVGWGYWMNRARAMKAAEAANDDASRAARLGGATRPPYTT